MHEPARIAHDVGILIDKEGVVGLDAGGGVGVVGAVPGGVGGELVIGLGDIVDVGKLALALDDVHGVLGKAGGGDVAVGVRPGAEAARAALFADGGLDLGKNLLEVARLSGQVDAQSAGIAHQRGGQVGLDEVAAVFKQLLEQGLGVRVVGAEVSGLLAVLAHPLGNLFKDVSLRTGNADVRGGVGSGLHLEAHAELLAGRLHDGDAAAHGLVSEVAREGDMNKGVAAKLVRGADDEVAAGNEVVVAHEVGSRADLRQILMRLTGDAEDVGATLLDLAEGLGRAGDGLVDDDRLHVGVVGQVDDALDGGLQLFGEVVGIGHEGDVILAVELLERFRAAAVVLRLGDGTGHDTDVNRLLLIVRSVRGVGCVGGSLVAAGHERKHHDQSEQDTQESFHAEPPISFLRCIARVSYYYIQKYSPCQ